MIDRDLAEMYGVETKVLNQAVRRNKDRFPNDFMFELNTEETLNLKSQIVTSSWGGSRKSSLVFAEQGIAMLSSVLHSPHAIQMNIQIIRTFTKLREILSDNKKLSEKIEKMERTYDKHIYEIFQILKRLTMEHEQPKERMGFRRE